MRRRYEALLCQHFREDHQMAFVAGPRQVGKTTTCTSFADGGAYFNWDNEDHRQVILAGPAAVAEQIGLAGPTTVVFDELHKYPHWKSFLKGFFDTYARSRLHVVVSGSARLDVFRKGADSLMGRYFAYRMHPLSVAEVLGTRVPERVVSSPTAISEEDFQALLHFGGFPEPFLRRDRRFYNRWKRNRLQLLFREDLRDVSRIHELAQVELLAEFLRQQSGQLTNYASLARKLRASQDSIRRWTGVLESLYYCFPVRPWTRNVTRSLLKEPKTYLWDWSLLTDDGARHENFVACHLLKAVHWGTDSGLGEFGLHYLRTKDGREVDFLVSKDGQPWFLVEVKTGSGRPLGKNLKYFQDRIGAEHAFQVCIDAEYRDRDCFELHHPVKVPARTFLSQLV